jgi:predicted AAA+ superfamily ATPase
MLHFTHMHARLLEPRLKREGHHILLLGQRQVGKSTLLGSLQPGRTSDVCLVSLSLNTARLDPTIEASIRELIASGDHRAALERARAAYKSCRTAASETLLVDAATIRE